MTKVNAISTHAITDVTTFENIMKKRNLSYFKKEVDHGCYEYVCSKLVV